MIVKKPKAVLFDLDGTLVDSMPFFVGAWQQAFAEHGISVSAEEIYAREGEHGSVTVRNILDRDSGAAGTVKSDSDRTEAANRIFARYQEIFRQIYRTQLYPGVDQLLAGLKESGVKLALVTGSSNLHERFSKESSPLKYFDCVVTGADTTVGKPAPDPYLLALSRVGESPADVFVVENAPFGVQSGVAAGLPVVAVVGSSPISRWVFERLGAVQVFDELTQCHHYFGCIPVDV